MTKELKIQPIAGSGNRVFIETIDPETIDNKTEGGIILAKVWGERNMNGVLESVEVRPTQGYIVAVSEEDSSGRKPQVKVGDKVLFAEHIGFKVSYELNTYITAKESDLQAIIP